MRRTESVCRSRCRSLRTGLCALICAAVLAAGGQSAKAADPDQRPDGNAGREAEGISARSRSSREPGAARLELPFDLRRLERFGWNLVRSALAWYERTPPADRVCQGGLAACAWLGIGVVLERMFRLRGRRIVPPDFTERFLDRLHEGKL